MNLKRESPHSLKRIDAPAGKAPTPKEPPPPILSADRENGIIVLDADTRLTGVPAEAWNYQLGNRSAIEWVLDQHKEKTPKDPVIRERFSTYRFVDYKEQAVTLLKRVTTVSLETMRIVEAMRPARR